MKKVENILYKYRHLVAMTAILTISLLILAWVGYDTLPLASTQSERVIVNDDYSTITQPIKDEKGIKQTIQVKANSKLYGVSLNFHIFNRVQFGTAHVDLLDCDGNLIASSSRDMSSILDNTFKGFIFDKMQYSARDAQYILHIWAEPQTDEDCFALWRSDKVYDGFEMTENGAESVGTVAVQYINRHVGNSIYGWYAIFAALVLTGLVLSYICIFVIKAPPHVSFAVSALFMGMIFCLFTPINGGPDKYVHLASSYKISNSILGVRQNPDAGKLTVRSCDAETLYDSTVSYNSFSFSDIYNGILLTSDSDTYVDVDARTADVFKPMYMAQALGITVARLLNLGFVPMILTGRLFNLLQYIVLVCLAIKIMPIYKTTLAIISLFPMCMQIAGNFAYDAYVISMAFLFTAIVFSLTYGAGKITYKSLIPLCLVLCMLVPAKTIYIVMGLLVFMLPNSKFDSKKKALLGKSAVLLCAVLFWAFTNLGSVINTLKPHSTAAPNTTVETEELAADITDNGMIYPYEIMMSEMQTDEQDRTVYDPESDILPNGDSKYYYSIPYILQNMKATIKLILRTITTHTGKYLQTIVGTRLGEIIVVDLQASWIWFIAIVSMLYRSVIPVKGREYNHTRANKLLGIGVFFLVVARVTATCIMWTPVNYRTIFGIQGRYFLPALPVFIMALAPKNLRLEKNVDGILLWGILAADVLVVLNVFMIMTVNIG